MYNDEDLNVYCCVTFKKGGLIIIQYLCGNINIDIVLLVVQADINIGRYKG